MDRIIGRCSKCGGNVCEPTAWMGLFPPTPTCSNCGAVKKSSLPVIEMEDGVRDQRQLLNELVKEDLVKF